MDCQMPLSMDGFQTTQEIRAFEKEKKIPKKAIIVALTANAMSGIRDRCLEAGMDDYLTKPIDFNKLTNIVSK